MNRSKMPFIGRVSAFLLALFVSLPGYSVEADSLRCQQVFLAPRHHATDAPNHQSLVELTELLRRAGFHEFKEGSEGIDLLNRIARQNNQIFHIYIKALKAVENTVVPGRPEEIVRTLELLLGTPMQDCRGGNCTSSFRSNRSCATGNCNSRLIEETLITGEQRLVFQYRESISLYGHPLRIWMSEPVTMDNLTGALTPKGMGVRALNEILHAAQTRQSPSAFVFIDVNDLSKVNYFRNAYQDGDSYIRAVGRILKGNLRTGDTFVRLGGDEFVLILDPASPEAVRDLSQRLILAVSNDPEASSIFRNQWKFIEDRISEIGNASELKQLSAEAEQLIWALKDDLKKRALEQNRTQVTFQDFRSDATEVLRNWLLKQKVLLAPNVSIGSTFIRPGDTLDSVVYRASCNANLCKRTHKEALGADARKYGGAAENEQLILRNAHSGSRPLPQALFPDHVKADAPNPSIAQEKNLLTLEDFYR